MPLPSFLTSGNPFKAELEASLAEFRALETMHADRVSRMQRYRDEGNRVRDPNIDVHTADLSDYGRRPKADGQPRRHRIPLPLAKATTVKHAYRIAGRLPDIIVDQRNESRAEEYRSDSMEKIAWSVIRASNGETAFSAASWNGSEIGAGCFDLYMDYALNMPRFRSVDPIGILEVQGVDDPHDFQRVYRYWDSPVVSVQAEYRDKTFRGLPIDVSQIGGRKNQKGVEMVTIVQVCDREKVVRFVIGTNGPIGLFESVHNYGFVPYVVIPNLGPFEDVWGWADYEFTRALAEYIPMLFSREADVLRSVAAGAYQESGTGLAAATIAKIVREGGVASIKRETEIKPIQAAEMPNFAESHADRAMELFKMLAFAPDAAWGLPGTGTASDRILQLQPLAEYTAMKQLNWQHGLQRLFSMVYRMIEQKMVGTSTYSGAKQLSGGRKQPFSFTFGPTAQPDSTVQDDPMGLTPEAVDLPRTPKDLFDGDYAVRFSWRNMVDPDDPAYVMSEVNKFSQGLQSMETTLENLGVQAPEDEMKRIEAEAQRFPWVNQGLVALLRQQLAGSQQGMGGGATSDASGAIAGAAETMAGLGGGGMSGALDQDAATAAFGGSGPYTGAA